MRFQKMAGIHRLRKYLFSVTGIIIVITVLIAIPVTGKLEETPQYSANIDDADTNRTIHRDIDGEVDIEDVEEGFQERRAYFTYYQAKEYSETYINNNLNVQTMRNAGDEATALATVYGQSVESDDDNDKEQENLLKAKMKSAKIKVSCLGAAHLLADDSSSLFNSSNPDLTFWMDFARNETKTVEIVNTTTLLHDVLYINPSIKSRANPSNCSVILFYARWCPFSAKAAPHFNALPRAFPSMRVAAVDSSMHPTVNTYFGILSVPTVILFHNGKIIAKFNDTLFTLNRFADFIHTFSDLQTTEKMNVTSQDFHGPLPASPIKEIDYYLYIAWIFIIICFIHYVSKSSIWNKVMDLVRTTWREAEAHHEHDD